MWKPCLKSSRGDTETGTSVRVMSPKPENKHVLFWGPLEPLFWISGDISSGFQSQSGLCLICLFFCGGECNAMYIPQDPPLVLHIPTSWQLAAWQPVTSPHACAEVGLCSDLNGQSPRQKANTLPLCQTNNSLIDTELEAWITSSWLKRPVNYPAGSTL